MREGGREGGKRKAGDKSVRERRIQLLQLVINRNKL